MANGREMKEQLHAMNERLGQVLEVLKTANEDGQQMDYVTHPSLANEVDRLADLTRRIGKIVYQE